MPNGVHHVGKGDRHATGKPVRGIRPGVRGPNKHADEILQEKLKQTPIVIRSSAEPKPRTPAQIAANAYLTPWKPGEDHDRSPSPRTHKLNRQLQGLIQEIGKEIISEETGWTRLEVVVRKLYTDAMSGKTAAVALLFERGWGRVPTPVQVDMRSEVLGLLEETGLTQAELQGDPVLRELIGNVIIDAAWKNGQSDPGTPDPSGETQSDRPD